MPTDRPETILSTARTKKKLPSANPVTFIVYILLVSSYEKKDQVESHQKVGLKKLHKEKRKEQSPVGNYMLEVNNRNTRTRCEICLKFTINTPERCHWCRSVVFIDNFEHISQLVLVL